MRIDSIFMSFTTRDNPMLHCAHSQLDQAMTWIKFGRRKFRTHLSRFMLPLTSRKKYGEDSSSFPLEAETGITGKNNLCSVCLLSELFRQVSWNSRNLEGRLFLEADRPSERTDVKKNTATHAAYGGRFINLLIVGLTRTADVSQMHNAHKAACINVAK